MDEYSVFVSARAEQQLTRILESDYGDRALSEKLAYIAGIEEKCRSLAHWPKRYAGTIINDREYRRVNYKAHAIFYRVFEEEKTVYIDAIFHGRMDFTKRL